MSIRYFRVWPCLHRVVLRAAIAPRGLQLAVLHAFLTLRLQTDHGFLLSREKIGSRLMSMTRSVRLLGCARSSAWKHNPKALSRTAAFCMPLRRLFAHFLRWYGCGVVVCRIVSRRSHGRGRGKNRRCATRTSTTALRRVMQQKKLQVGKFLNVKAFFIFYVRLFDI